METARGISTVMPRDGLPTRMWQPSTMDAMWHACVCAELTRNLRAAALSRPVGLPSAPRTDAGSFSFEAVWDVDHALAIRWQIHPASNTASPLPMDPPALLNGIFSRHRDYLRSGVLYRQLAKTCKGTKCIATHFVAIEIIANLSA